MAIAPAPAALFGLVAPALLFRAGARWVAMLFLVALAVGLVRARAWVDEHERARTELLGGAWPARCSVEGQVGRSPAVVGGGVRLQVENARIRCGDEDDAGGHAGLVVSLHVPLEIPLRVGRGDEVKALASLAPPYRFLNPGTGDPRPGAARRRVLLSGGAEDVVVVRSGRGVLRGIDRIRAHVRARIEATFPADTSRMARALVLGEDDLPTDDQLAFRRSGLSHLLAVSGMHLVLVVMGVVSAVRALLARWPALAGRWDVTRIASAIALPLTWIYADIAGGSGSAVRAAWMCSVTLLARAIGRRTSAWRALGLSVLAMSVLDPLIVHDLSFVLSALATLGLLALSRPLDALLSRRLPRLLSTPLATTAAATITCAPVIALMAPELAVSGLVANVFAVPVGEAAALPLCLFHALLAPWPAAEHGCAAAASGALTLVRIVARGFAWGAMPVPSPTREELAVLASVAVGAGLGSARRWTAVGALALVLLEVHVRLRGSPRGLLRVTFIDVGQGDSALVDFPDGSAMLVDGGGLVGSPIDVGERAILPLLAARRRSVIDTVMLSHPHPDHFLGLGAVLDRARVRAVWDTGQGEGEGVYLARSRALRIPVVRPVDLCGVHAMGGVILEVLAPCPGVAEDRSANDNSFVVRIRFGARAVLFVGDAEHEEEAELLRRGADVRADVLKVGHHGSRTSSSAAFLDAVRPTTAVISCGVRNRFGHPHAPTLAALSGRGIRVLRTDLDGGVVITTDGRDLDVRSSAVP